VGRHFGAAEGAVTKGGRRIPIKSELTVVLPEAAFKLLVAAAARRRKGEVPMAPEALAAAIISGTILRGSIDRQAALWHEYLIDTRSGGSRSDARSESAPAEGAEV
jgi:hypothetical protein